MYQYITLRNWGERMSIINSNTMSMKFHLKFNTHTQKSKSLHPIQLRIFSKRDRIALCVGWHAYYVTMGSQDIEDIYLGKLLLPVSAI